MARSSSAPAKYAHAHEPTTRALQTDSSQDACYYCYYCYYDYDYYYYYCYYYYSYYYFFYYYYSCCCCCYYYYYYIYCFCSFHYHSQDHYIESSRLVVDLDSRIFYDGIL